MSGSQLTLFLTGVRDGVEDWCQHIPVDPDKDAQVTEGQQSRVPVFRGSHQTPQTGWQRAHEKCKLNLVVALRLHLLVQTHSLCVCTQQTIYLQQILPIPYAGLDGNKAGPNPACVWSTTLHGDAMGYG